MNMPCATCANYRPVNNKSMHHGTCVQLGDSGPESCWRLYKENCDKHTLFIWKPHVDGFVIDNVGVFPGWFKSWEVWNRIDGEWSSVEPWKSYDNIECAKSAALILRGVRL